MRADKPVQSSKASKEVTMFKRVTIVALVVAAFLVLAVPAMAYNGYRDDYTTRRRLPDMPQWHRRHPGRV